MSSTSFEGHLELLCSCLAPQDASDAISTLTKIVENPLTHPEDEHYRRLNISNKKFNLKVWRHPNARDFMLAIGWVLIDDSVILPSDSLLQDALVALTKTKSTLDAQGESHSYVVVSEDASPDKHEDEVYKERMKQLRELQKLTDLEKKRISEQIKADRRETSQRKALASHSKDLQFGNGMTTFDDIGIDLNKTEIKIMMPGRGRCPLVRGPDKRDWQAILDQTCPLQQRG